MSEAEIQCAKARLLGAILSKASEANWRCRCPLGLVYPKHTKADPRRLPLRESLQKKGPRWDETLTTEKMKECRWVEPVLGCQVAFVEWTDDDNLQHFTFVGMRNEKEAAKIVWEA
jgi:ATP-dependent DNA ligase